MIKSLSLLLTLTATLLVAGTRAQTVPGDILRGKGRYLEGAGWYNLNTARAGRINVETWKASNREVQRLYRDYMMDRARRINYRRGLTGKLQDELQRKMEEDQRRWRENPTPADIASGDALNALAGDLADPSISPSAWVSARVDLPTSLTLTALAFKIADPKKSKLQLSTVAIDRMLVKDSVAAPLPPPRDRARVRRLREGGRGGRREVPQGGRAPGGRLRRPPGWVAELKKAVETAVPTRDNQRTQARDFVRRLDEATKDLRRAGLRRAAHPRRERVQGVDRGGAPGIHAGLPAPVLRPRQLARGGVALRGPLRPPPPAEGRAGDQDRARARRRRSRSPRQGQRKAQAKTKNSWPSARRPRPKAQRKDARRSRKGARRRR